MKPKICAITGHRYASLPFGNKESDPRCLRLREALRAEFIHLIESENVTTFLCGMALGSDQIAAEVLIHLKTLYPDLRILAYVPCQEQYLKWNQAQIARYRAILRHTEEIFCLDTAYTRASMHKRNRRMVDDADVLLAVYTPGKRGGTAATLAYAEKRALPIRIIDPVTL